MKLWIDGVLDTDRLIDESNNNAADVEVVLAASRKAAEVEREGKVWLWELSDPETGTVYEAFSNDPTRVTRPIDATDRYRAGGL